MVFIITKGVLVDRLLEASSDPMWVLLVFGGVLALCHYFFIKKYPLTLKRWKLVEYMWVGLALVSIFGIIEEARFYRSNISIERSRGLAMDKITALENWVDVYQEYACGDNGDDAEYLALCRWMKVKGSDLQLILANEVFPVDLPENFLVGIDGELNGLGKPDRAIVQGLHGDYRKARDQYLMAVREGRRSHFSTLIVALAPLIFAIAIAIKFTKVTGEYLLTK